MPGYVLWPATEDTGRVLSMAYALKYNKRAEVSEQRVMSSFPSLNYPFSFN